MSDPTYLPPQWRDASPAGRSDRSSRSVTPFLLRSQGRSDGQALEFHSRLSPSPSRTWRKRRARSGSKRRESEREMDKQTEEEEEDEELEGRQLESERKQERKMQHESSRSGMSRASTGTRREGGTVRRVHRHEEEEVVRSVTVRQRRLVGSLAKTSDYSSQSDTEKETAQQRTPANRPGRVDSRRDSPRFKAFDGDEWIHSPRTGYTYAQSLTYRDAATPGREVPMPHMARLPLHDTTHDYSQLDQLDTTEVWERSVREARTLAEFSDDEFSPSPPHKIFRHGAWSLAGSSKVPLSSSSSLYSYLHTLFFLLMLPLSILLSWSKLVFRVLVYDMPAFTHRIDLSLLLKSEHAKKFLSSGMDHTAQLFSVTTSTLASLLDKSSTMALRVTSGSARWVLNLFSRIREWFNPTLLLKDASGLISEDEDESGLTNFLASQKEQRAMEDRVEIASSRTTKTTSFFTRLVDWFNPSLPQSLMDGSGLISEDEDESGLSSFLISQKEQRLETETVVHSPGFVSMIKIVTEWLLSISTYVLALLGPRVPSNYTETEEDQPDRVRSPRRVMFKDLPEEPETGGVSPIWVEEIADAVQEPPAHFEKIISEKQHNDQLTEQHQTNSIQHRSPEATSSYSAFITMIGLPISMTMSAMHSVWVFLTKQPEPELRRSRRLRGLNPEERALERERRRRARKQNNGGKAENLGLVTDDEDSDEASSFADLNVKEKPKLKKTKSQKVENSSLWSWFVALFYRQKTRRRSRRLLGLGPEMEAQAVEKRTRGARKKKETLTDVLPSNQAGDADAEDSVSDIEDEDDEAEFIPFAMLTSIWLAIKTFCSQIMHEKLWIVGKDHVNEAPPPETETSIYPSEEKSTKKQGIIRRALDSKSPFWSWGVSFFFRQKPRRRSRRLQGLGPEMEAQLDKISGRRSTRRTKTENQEVDTTVSENVSIAEENLSDSDSESDEIEFVPLAFLISLWQSLYSLITGTPQTDNDDNLNRSETSFLKRTSTFISHCWMNFASQFYRPKPKRRSRRLMGLQPEMEGEEARKRKSRGRKANGASNGTNSTEGTATASPNAEEQGIGIAEMITEMDSDEEEEVEFIPFAIAVSMWKRICSIFLSTSLESEEELFEADTLESDQEDAAARKPMHTRFLSYIFTILSWFAAIFYRPRQTRASRRLQGLEPELKGQQVTKKARTSSRKHLGDISDVKVDSSQTEASTDNDEAEGDEFIPFALFCSLWTTIKKAIIKGDIKEIQSQNGLTPEDPDTKSTWSLSWIDWGYLKQALRSTPGEVLAAPLNGMNGGPEISADQIEPKTTSSLVAWPCLAWTWITSMFYREKQTRRSRRLMGLGPEMEAAAEKRRALRKRKGVEEDISETPSEDIESPSEQEFEFIPKAWAISILTGFCNVFHWLSALPCRLLYGPSNLSEENLRLHNARISAGGAHGSVGTWLGNSQGGQSTDESLVATAFNEVEIAKDTVEAHIDEDREMTKKANNMFSFLFNLGFLPTWSTSWFWSSKGTRKSRRLRGLEPVEIDALETWKSRTRAGKASIEGSVIEKDSASEISEDDYSTDKYLLLLLFFLLAISLLYIAILPFCSAHPDTCRAPYRSLQKTPAVVSNLLRTAGNSTVDLLHSTGDKVITGASHLQDLLASSVYSLSSSFSGLRDFTLSLLATPWHLLDQIISSVSSLGSWIAATSSSQLSSAANVATDLANLTLSTFSNILSGASSGIFSFGQTAWKGAASFTVSIWGSFTNGLTTFAQGLGNASLACWSGLCSLPSYLSSMFIAPFSSLPSLVSILQECLLFLGDLGSSTIETIANGAWHGLFLLTSLASKPAGLLLAGINATVSSMQDFASSSVDLGASIWDGGITSASSLINEVSSIDFFYPVYKTGHMVADVAMTFGSSVASILAWPLTLDYLAPFSSALDLLSSAWSGFTAWVTSFDFLAPFNWAANLFGSVWSGAVDQISSLNLLTPFTLTWDVITSSYNSLLEWTSNLNPLAIFSWTWNLMTSTWHGFTAWISSLNLLSPFYWTGNAAISCLSTATEWVTSISPMAPFSAAWTFVINNFQEFSSWVLSFEPLAPFSWIGSSLLSPMTWVWSSLADFFSSLLDYQGFSSFHLSPIAWLLNIGTSCLEFLQEAASYAYGSIISINLLSPFSWVWTLLSSSASTASSGLTAAGGAVGDGIGATASSIGLLLAAAWTRATGLVVPEKSASSENQLDMDQLIEKVLNSNRFLSAVNEIANKKVEGEASRFQEQLATSLASQQLSQEEQSKVTADYQSRLESIKLDVAEEIKKMTEQYMKINMESVEQSNAKADAQDLAINGLKEKYLQMLAETEALQGSLASQGDQLEGANQETLKEVAALKAQILVLEEQQKMLNETLAGCCKNASVIEISVERHLATLMESVMAGGEGGSEAAKTFSSWLTTHLVARTELEARLSSLSSEMEARLGGQAQDTGATVKREVEEVGQQLMDRVSHELRQEMERQLHELKVTNSDVPAEQGLNRTEVLEIVKNSLIQYDADKTGMFDYALETAGGSVVSTRCTETFVQKTAMYSIFGIPIWYPSNNPRTIIQPGVQPGECWAFKGSSGYIVIQLSEPIVPTRFSMEHISKSMSPSGKIDSAPKDFVVYGLRSEKDGDPVRLGAFTYSQDTDPLQFFELTQPITEPFPFVELDILSNHGNVNYTCLYRFRVHGLRP